MGAVTAADIRSARSSGARDNFSSKRARKAYRKGVIRGFGANITSDIRNAHRERMEFYRNLRTLKMRRRKIAKEMHALSQMVEYMAREVDRADERLPGGYGEYAERALGAVKEARKSVVVAADEFEMFSRQRVYFRKER